MLDREGRAVERLKDVYTYDSRGALSDKALFLCGHVNWYNEDYQDADLHFTMLHEKYPDSPFAPYAVELAIKAKLMSTGGELYDGRKVAEARKMVDEAPADAANERGKEERSWSSCWAASTPSRPRRTSRWPSSGGAPAIRVRPISTTRSSAAAIPTRTPRIARRKRMLEIYAKMEKEQLCQTGTAAEGGEGRPMRAIAAAASRGQWTDLPANSDCRA